MTPQHQWPPPATDKCESQLAGPVTRLQHRRGWQEVHKRRRRVRVHQHAERECAALQHGLKVRPARGRRACQAHSPRTLHTREKCAGARTACLSATQCEESLQPACKANAPWSSQKPCAALTLVNSVLTFFLHMACKSEQWGTASERQQCAARCGCGGKRAAHRGRPACSRP